MKMKPSGNCYQAAFEHTMSLNDAREQAVLLVHGSLIPTSGPWSGNRITHAWVQVGEMIHEFSGQNSIVVDKPRFVKTFEPEVYATYSPCEAIMQNLQNRHYGPWDEVSERMGELESQRTTI